MILLIRHAKPVIDEGDPELGEEGILQAKQLAKKLANYRIDYCYVSTLKRAYQTWMEYNKIKPETPREINDKTREIYRVIIGGPT